MCIIHLQTNCSCLQEYYGLSLFIHPSIHPEAYPEQGPGRAWDASAECYCGQNAALIITMNTVMHM